MTNHIKIYGVVPRKQYIADGSSTAYEFPFAIFSTDDIEVYLDNIKQSSTLYTVTGVRDSSGGSITFNTAPTLNTIITIVRNLSIERTSDFQEGGALRADILNDEFDYQIACQQQLADNLNRSMVLPPYATDTNVDLTLPTPAAGKAIVWNSDGTNLENSTVAVNALESTLKGYKETAESAATTAATKAGIASDAATTASAKADIATTKAAEAASTVSSKANKDMDNLSATGKSNLILCSMPDYTAGIEVKSYNSASNKFTAPSMGWIYIVKNLNGSIYINETTLSNASSSNTSGDEVFIPVLKDTTYYNTGNISHATFYPCKGV